MGQLLNNKVLRKCCTAFPLTDTITAIMRLKTLVFNALTNAPVDTIEIILKTVFTANHLTVTDKQNSTRKYAD